MLIFLGFDPCTNNVVLGNQESRCLSVLMSGYGLCDKFITERWYRMDDGADIPTSCPSPLQCNSQYPVWMIGENSVMYIILAIYWANVEFKYSDSKLREKIGEKFVKIYTSCRTVALQKNLGWRIEFPVELQFCSKYYTRTNVHSWY